MWNAFKTYFSKKQTISKPTCQICLQQIGPKDTTQICKCEHTYCQSCVSQYVDARIKAFEIVKCLDQKCHLEIDQNLLFYKSLPQQTKLKYEKIKRFYFVSKNPNFKLCPKESCTGLVNTKKKPCTCNACSQKFCPKCLLKEHWGKCQKQSVVFLQNNLKYIQCSHCNFIIQKNEGCDHITCKCGYQLCYKCGGVWKGPKHLCVRSKWFQKVRSFMLYSSQKSGIVLENSIIQKFFNGISTVLVNTLWVNSVLAVILTVVEIIYTVFSWISPFGFISDIFIGKDEVDSAKETVVEESGFSYLWVLYLGLVFMSWFVVKKIHPNCQIKFFLMVVAAITGILYMLSNLFLIFYYEYIFLSYIVENILSVVCVATSLLGIIYSVQKVGFQILSRKKSIFTEIFQFLKPKKIKMPTRIEYQ